MKSTRALPLIAATLACVAASCAFEFGEYDLEQADTTTVTTGSGGAGGEAPTDANGMPCTDDGDCVSGNCLENNTEGGKICCALPCAVMDQETCGRNGNCDASGLDCALYDAGTTCGQSSCADGTVTAAQCKAAVCDAGETMPCDGGLGCADTTTCNDTCTTSEECANPTDETPGGQCDGDECSERPAGAPCEDGTQCVSGVCGTGGPSRCCATACPVIEGACGPTGCDEAGDCVFPKAETACGTDPSCTGGNLATTYCNGDGACSLESTLPCAGNLSCANATSCYATCGSNDDTGDERCPAGFWCDGSTCHQASFDEGSACLRDGQCSSDVCTPAGLCTAAACDMDMDGYIRDDPHCVGDDGERDCDDTDARAHPGQTDFFDTPRATGGYDFDCNTLEEPEQPTSCVCSGSALLVPPGAAGCGVTGTIRNCYQFFFFCGPNDTANTATQLCR